MFSPATAIEGPSLPAPNIETNTEAKPVRSDLAIRLEILSQMQAGETRQDRRRSLPLSDITIEPEVFKLRQGDLIEWHLSNLRSALKIHGELDDITVIPCGASFVLVEGHHRLEAYRREHRREIPVVYFEGTPVQARSRAIRNGIKVAVPLSPQERGTLAWQNLLSGAYSLKAIVGMTGVSRQNMDIMSKVRRALGDTAFDYAQWWQAREAYTVLQDPEKAKAQLTPDEWAEYEMERGRELADKLRKVFGDKLLKNPNITAHAFGLYLGRKAAETIERMHQHEYVQADAEDDLDTPF